MENKILNFEQAQIEVFDGTIICNTTINPSYYSFYRNVVIKWNNENEITVTGNRAVFRFFDETNNPNSSFYGPDSSVYNEELFHLVSEDKIIEYNEPVETFCDIFFGRKPKKFKKVKRIKYGGWIELKETNIPFTFTANNYLIIQS